MTKTTDTTRTIDFDPTEPFKGLCQFVELWTESQRVHCEGIDALWSVDDNLVVTFRFVYKALDEIEIVLLQLREAKTSCL